MTTTTAPTTPTTTTASLSALHARIERELGPRPRTRYALGLLVSLTAGLALLTMWATEPTSLPARTQLAFAALSLLDLVWVAFFARVLFVRQAWFGHPRVVASTIGLVASLVWLAFAVAIVAARGVWPLGWTAIVCAASFVVLATAFRHQAVRELERLQSLARELEALVAA